MSKKWDVLIESAPLLNQSDNTDSTSDVIIQMEAVESPQISDINFSDEVTSKTKQNGVTFDKPSKEVIISQTVDKDKENESVGQLPVQQDTSVDGPVNELNTKLLDAIVNQNNIEVERLLKQGASPNATCRAKNLTACHAAAYTNDYALSLLLQYNAIKDRTDTASSTPLHLAVWAGNIKNIVMLLGLDRLDIINNKEADDGTKLIPHINNSNIDMQCKYKPVSEVQDSWRCGNKHICEKFMASLIKLYPGWTPLHVASFNADHNSTRLLLAAGANPHKKDVIGNTPLAIAGVAYRLKTYTIDINSYVETITYLLESRQKMYIPVEACLSELSSALHTAVQLGSDEAVQILLSAGAPVEQLNDRGNTPLHECVLASNKTILQLLVRHRGLQQSFSTVNLTDVDGNTVLQKAVLTSWLPGVCISLDAGVNITHKAKNGCTAIHLAARSGHLEILNQILNTVNDVKAVNDGNVDVETPLICAIRSGNLECVKALINKGASLQLNTVPNHTDLSKREMDTAEHFLADRVHSYGKLNSSNLAYSSTRWKTIKTKKLSLCTIVHAVWIHESEAEYVNIFKFLFDYDKSLEKLLDYRCPHYLSMIPVEVAAVDRKNEIYQFLLKKSVETSQITFDPPLLWSYFYMLVRNHVSLQGGNFNITEYYHNTLKETVAIFPDTVHILPMHKAYILHDAIEQNNRDLILLLIHNGADLSLCNKTGETAISLFMKLSNSTEFVERIFDSCVEFCGDFKFRDVSVVRFDYRVLAPQYNNNYNEGQMRVLKSFLETGDYKGQRKLLMHPLVESFLYKKWQTYSTYFCIIIFLYVFFSVSLSVYIVSVFYYKDQDQSLPKFWDPFIWRYIMFTILCIIFLQELSFIHLRISNWIKSRPPIEQFIELSVHCVIFGLAFATPLVITTDSPDSEWRRYWSTTTLFLTWSYIMLLLSKTPTTGYFIQMFWNVSFKIVKVLMTFSSLIIMFSFCFMIQFHTQEPFDGPLAAIVKTLVMMTSEFDYEDNFSNEKSKNFSSRLILRFVFVVFLILSTIALMNLMLGVAVSDVQYLVHKGNLRRIEKQIEYLYSFEVNRKYKSVFHIFGLHEWLKCNNVLVGRQLQPTILDYEHQFNENIRETLKNKAQEHIRNQIKERESQELQSKVHDVIQATARNEQNTIRNEIKIHDVLTVVTEIKENIVRKNRYRKWSRSVKCVRKSNKTYAK